MAWTFMHSGLVRKVDVEGIRRALDSEAMVLISPFGFSPTGEAFNLSHGGGRHPRGQRAARPTS